ncbi:MAG: bifunctional nuclease family protein [Actinobacteria bacterium]|jgi:bifunctional DNase/RNase|nr:bifunctional nuclease family protein [Actinomycetota bacterium]MCL6104107.1 bifunctional nuclease family protein [Actinomycetota bacterium]
MVEVRLSAVRVDLHSNTPVLLLEETGGAHRILPVFVGIPEATAIALVLQGISTPRPMTHDLIVDFFNALGVKIESVIITELQSATFYADIYLNAFGTVHAISARPSDAVAIAVRTDTPLYVADDLMDSEGMILNLNDDEGEDDSDELVGQFRQFLNEVKPEDFTS